MIGRPKITADVLCCLLLCPLGCDMERDWRGGGGRYLFATPVLCLGQLMMMMMQCDAIRYNILLMT